MRLWSACLVLLTAAQELEPLLRDDECSESTCAQNALQLHGLARSNDSAVPQGTGTCEDCMMSNSAGANSELLGAGPRIYHYAQNCWYGCGRKSGSCDHFCGPGNACCRYRYAGPPECQGVGFWPVLSFHTCVASSLPPSPAPPMPAPELPGATPLAPAGEEDESGLKMKVKLKSSLYAPKVQSLTTNSSAPLHEFYVYRAMGDSSYPLENVNAANAAGVMWYLHNEVVIFTPRKFGINRIVRFKVQYRAPQPLHEKGMDFGVRYAFDSGKCTGPGDCASDFDKYGYFVGCNLVYDFPTYQFKDAKYYGNPTWYSFPGPCYSKSYKDHTDKCVLTEPGGACPSLDPSGTGDCTYHYEPAGEVKVDDVVGISDYAKFWHGGGREYIPGLGSGHQLCKYHPQLCDKGWGTAFWNDKHSEALNHKRVERLLQAFQQKYPESPILPDVPCNFNQYKFYH